MGAGKITQIGAEGVMEVEERIQSLRDFSETLDLLYDSFCERRLAKDWKSDLKKIQAWLESDQSVRRRAAA